MANHKSAKKAARQAIKRTEINKSRMTRIRTSVKKVESLAPGSVSKDEALATLRNAESEMMRGVTKGVLKKNTVARKISRLAKRIKTLAVK